MFRMPFIVTLRILRTRTGLAALAVGVALMTAAFFSLPAQASAATVRTDQTDYSPGETVIITGSGWQPGEMVSLLIHEDPTVCSDRVFYGVADDKGNFINTQLVIE